MPTGPQGQKRPVEPERNALKILKIATGECEEGLQAPSTQPAKKPKRKQSRNMDRKTKTI